MVQQYHVEAVERAIEQHTTPLNPSVHIVYAVTEDDFGLYHEAFSYKYEAEEAVAREMMRADEWPEGVIDFTIVTFYRE